MRKMLLILAFAMVAVAGRSQRYYWEDSVYMAYADTLNQVYTGPLKMHAQYVLRMLDGKISCMERYDYDYSVSYHSSEINSSFSKYPLVSSFLSRLEKEIHAWLKKNARYVKTTKREGFLVGGTGAEYWIPGTIVYSNIQTFWAGDSEWGGVKGVAEEWVDSWFAYKYPDYFKAFLYNLDGVDWRPYLQSEKLRALAKEAVACKSLKKVCSQNGFYNEKLAYDVAIHICLSIWKNHLYADENLGKKALFLNDCVVCVNTLLQGKYGKNDEYGRKILALFN